MVRSLLDAGACTSIKDLDGFTVIAQLSTMCLVVKAQNYETRLNQQQLAWLKKNIGIIGNQTDNSANQYEKKLEIIKAKEFERRDIAAQNQLQQAIANGDIDAVRRLVHSSDLEKLDSDGFTPLMTAALRGQLKMV